MTNLRELAPSFKDNVVVTLTTKSGVVIGKWAKEEIVKEEGFVSSLVCDEILSQNGFTSFQLNLTVKQVREYINKYIDTLGFKDFVNASKNFTDRKYWTPTFLRCLL